MKPGSVWIVRNIGRTSVQQSSSAEKGNKMFTAMLQWADPTRATDKSPRSTTAQCFLPHTHSTFGSWTYSASSHNCERALGQNKNSRLLLQQQGTKMQARSQYGMIRINKEELVFCFVSNSKLSFILAPHFMRLKNDSRRAVKFNTLWYYLFFLLMLSFSF